MIDKRVESAEAAIDGVGDGAAAMVSGFQGAGTPNALLDALLAKRLRGLTLVVNGVGHHGTRVAALFEARCVARRSEEHKSELQSLMRSSYAVFCLKKKHNHL